MAATLLLWRSHEGARSSFAGSWGRISNAGHVALVLFYESAAQTGVKSEIATITWLNDGHIGSKTQSATVIGAPSGHPQSSGKSAGHVPAPQNMKQRHVMKELELENDDRHVQEIEDLENKQRLRSPQDPFTMQDQLRLNQLRKFYPTLRAHVFKQSVEKSTSEQRWLDTVCRNYKNKYGQKCYDVFMKTRIRPPDQQITIPTTCDDNVIIGLNDVGMMLWWQQFADQKKTYNFLSRNCSTVCGNALIAGGGASFVKSPVSFVWEPQTAFNWGQKIAKVIEQKNLFYRAARDAILHDNGDEGLGNLNNPQNPVWNVTEWKSQSSVSWAHRYSALKEVDLLLESYHLSTPLPFASKAVRRSVLTLKLAAVVLQLYKIINDHEKGRNARKSKRHKSIIALGKQCLGAIDTIKKEEQRELQKATTAGTIASHYMESVYNLERALNTDIKSIEEAHNVLAKQVGLNSDDWGMLHNEIMKMSHARALLGFEPPYVMHPDRYLPTVPDMSQSRNQRHDSLSDISFRFDDGIHSDSEDGF